MAKPEQKIVDAVRRIIGEHGGYSLKTHGNMYQAGQPDIIGCIDGRMIVIECKAPGKLSTLSPLQSATLDKWAAAGAIALACDNPDTFKQQLKDNNL